MTIAPWHTGRKYQPGQTAVVNNVESVVLKNSEIPDLSCETCPAFDGPRACPGAFVCNDSLDHGLFWYPTDKFALLRLKGKA